MIEKREPGLWFSVMRVWERGGFFSAPGFGRSHNLCSSLLSPAFKDKALITACA